METERRPQWRQALTVASHDDERWTEAVAKWSPGLVPALKVPHMRRLENEINNLIHRDTGNDNQQHNDLIIDDTWRREAKKKKGSLGGTRDTIRTTTDTRRQRVSYQRPIHNQQQLTVHWARKPTMRTGGRPQLVNPLRHIQRGPVTGDANSIFLNFDFFLRCHRRTVRPTSWIQAEDQGRCALPVFFLTQISETL